MDKKSILTLSRKECQSEYKKILQKSDNQLAEAQEIEGKRGYDTASSLLIFSTENLLIGFVLYLEGIGFNLRKVKGVNRFLNRDHHIRYKFALVLSFFSSFVDDLEKFGMLIAKEPEKLLNFPPPGTDAFNEMVKSYCLEKITHFKVEISFYSKIDKERKRGLYSDETNNTISKEEYEAVKNRHIKLRTLVNSIIRSMAPQEIPPDDKLGIDAMAAAQRMKKKLTSDFNGKFFAFFEKQLSIINNPQYDSYTVLLESIKEFERNITKMTSNDWKEINEQ